MHRGIRDKNGDSTSMRNWKLVLPIVVLIAALCLCPNLGLSAQASRVVINELEPNPFGLDEGNEWVELYNPTSSSVDLGGWKLSTTHGQTVTVELKTGTVIQPRGYHIVTNESQWLDNENECVVLRDESGNEVDRTPVLSDTEGDSRSWSRYPNGKDTDAPADWRFQTSTKGTSNGKVTTNLTLTITAESLGVGQTVAITGSVAPSPGQVQVMLILTRPDGTTITRNLVTSSDGRFSDSVTVDKEGRWNAQANWLGDEDYFGAASSSVGFDVKQSISPFATMAMLAVLVALVVGLLVLRRMRKPRVEPPPPPPPDTDFVVAQPSVQIGRAVDLFGYIKKATHTVKVVSPWISEDVSEEICTLAMDRKLRFDIITSPDTEVQTHVRALATFRQFPTAGVRVRIMRGDRLHAKMIIIDEAVLIVGSVNLTFYGLHENIEGYVVLMDTRSIADALSNFGELWRRSDDLTPSSSRLGAKNIG
jgi:hypothetical protein